MAKIRKGMIFRDSKKGSIAFHINASGGTSVRPGFEACVRVGSSTYRNRKFTGTCAMGRTPRLALSRALNKLARGVKGRTGTFKGLK